MILPFRFQFRVEGALLGCSRRVIVLLFLFSEMALCFFFFFSLAHTFDGAFGGSTLFNSLSPPKSSPFLRYMFFGRRQEHYPYLEFPKTRLTCLPLPPQVLKISSILSDGCFYSFAPFPFMNSSDRHFPLTPFIKSDCLSRCRLATWHFFPTTFLPIMSDVHSLSSRHSPFFVFLSIFPFSTLPCGEVVQLVAVSISFPV